MTALVLPAPRPTDREIPLPDLGSIIWGDGPDAETRVRLMLRAHGIQGGE